jgi:RNA polymerase sigma-70 factor (ECF subfamily)
MVFVEENKIIAFDDTAFRERQEQVEKLVKEHDRALRRYLRAQLAVEADRDDLIQEIYFRVVRHTDLEKFQENTRAYLFKTATNLLRDRARRRAVRKSDSQREVEEFDLVNSVTPEQELQSRQNLDVVKKVLAELPESCRQAFLLSRFSSKNHQEIGKKLGVSASMVEKHVARAMLEVRRAMMRHGLGNEYK